jgi:transposase
MAQVKAALSRIQPQVEPADFELMERLAGIVTFVTTLLRAQRTTIARMRRFFGMSSSEKRREVIGPQPDANTDSAGTPPSEGQEPAGKPDKPDAESGATGSDATPHRAKGHGRLAATDYQAATHFTVSHNMLSAGCRCPGCGRGSLYELKEPARIVRIVGQPILAALCWNCQRLRCSGCGEVYTAEAPIEAQGPKFDETAVSMIALCRYGAGLPHHRLERSQRNVQTPIASSTQWQVTDQSAPTFQPVLEYLEFMAAQGALIHNDDTYVRILSFMGEARAKLLRDGQLPDPERTGLFTTAIISVVEGKHIALFYSGRKHAGEHLARLLTARDVDREPPILMSDALNRNVPNGHAVVEANCTAHARRGIVDQYPNFPAECRHVLELLRVVFSVDALCKQYGLSPEQRLLVHQRGSEPVMDELREWMTSQLAQKLVEPNSDLGKSGCPGPTRPRSPDRLSRFLQRRTGQTHRQHPDTPAARAGFGDAEWTWLRSSFTRVYTATWLAVRAVVRWCLARCGFTSAVPASILAPVPTGASRRRSTISTKFAARASCNALTFTIVGAHRQRVSDRRRTRSRRRGTSVSGGARAERRALCAQAVACERRK